LGGHLNGSFRAFGVCGGLDAGGPVTAQRLVIIIGIALALFVLPLLLGVAIAIATDNAGHAARTNHALRLWK